MQLEKKTLSVEEIEAQTALELPERELLQITQSNTLNQTATGLIAANVGVGLNLCAVCVGSIG